MSAQTARKVAILGGKRIPFARSMGAYMGLSNQALMEASLKALVDAFGLSQRELGEVALGAVIKHTSEWNLAREATIGAGLSPRTPAFDVQQACGTSLETAILIANKIALGQIEVGIAGGVDTNSDLPVVFPKAFGPKLLKLNSAKTTWDRLRAIADFGVKDWKPVVPGVVEPRTGLSMGQSCEQMAQKWQIARAAQDELALASHINADRAYQNGFYQDLVIKFAGLKRDNNLRADTTLAKLAKLRTVFDSSDRATLTAGNSTPLTDGSAAVLLSSDDWAATEGHKVLAYLTHMQVAAVDFVKDEGLLMAPAYAVPTMLDRAGLKFSDFDFFEIHEAFAAQVLCTLKAWESVDFCRDRLGRANALGPIPREKLNVSGGSLAIGHPFAATGARIIASLAKMLDQKGSGRGLISICTAGGMGVTAILEK